MYTDYLRVWNVEDSALCRPQGTVRKDSSLDFQIVVSPEKVTLIGGRGGGIYLGGSRRIYLNRPHLKNPPLTYLGDWIGHWGGDTLVADGIGFNEISIWTLRANLLWLSVKFFAYQVSILMSLPLPYRGSVPSHTI